MLLLKKKQEEKMLPKSFYEAFIFFTWKQEKDYKKRNPQANISYKCRNKTIQWNTRKSSTIEDWKACTWLVNAIYSKELRKSVNAMYYINKAKNQDHIVTTIDAQKALDKIQHHFMKKKKGTKESSNGGRGEPQDSRVFVLLSYSAVNDKL